MAELNAINMHDNHQLVVDELFLLQNPQILSNPIEIDNNEVSPNLQPLPEPQIQAQTKLPDLGGYLEDFGANFLKESEKNQQRQITIEVIESMIGKLSVSEAGSTLANLRQMNTFSNLKVTFFF